MRRRTTMATLAAAVLLASALPALAQDGDVSGPDKAAVQQAKAEAKAAKARAQDLGEQGRQDGDPPPGLTKARDKVRGWEKTGRGNAGRVHAALLAGRSPSEVKGQQAEAAKAMAKATKALKEAGEKPGLGLGRGGAKGPKDGATDDG